MKQVFGQADYRDREGAGGGYGDRKPTQNALVELFNGWLRDECLNETLFTPLVHARSILAALQHDYNTVRAHSKLRGRTPAEIAGQRGWGHPPTP